MSMTAKDLEDLIPDKKRTVNSLVRFMNTRAENQANYAFLLGAGASVNSGVRAASSLVDEWKKELSEEWKVTIEELETELHKPEARRWYNSASEYSSLFEYRYDQQKQRRAFVESEIQNSFPSLGYSYLVNLVENDFSNVVFTTNFDDLLNEAFYYYGSKRPIVCSHDGSVTGITVSSRRPKIMKLHGDYLFEDIKCTLRQTESLADNIKLKLTEFLKEYGLIVSGYGGGDRSILDVLRPLVRDDNYLKNGLYWTFREDDEINDEVFKLLNSEGVFYVITDGFDELMAELHDGVCGQDLPFKRELLTSTLNGKKLADRIVDSNLKESNHPIIGKHLLMIEEERQSSTALNLLGDIFEDSLKMGEKILEQDMWQISSIEKLIHSGNLDEALLKINEFVNTAKSKNALARVYATIAMKFKRDGKQSQAKTYYEKAAKNDNNNVRFKLRSIDCDKSIITKLDGLKKLEDDDTFNISIQLSKANLENSKFGRMEIPNLKEIQCDSIKKAYELDPCLDNPALLQMVDAVDSSKQGLKLKDDIRRIHSNLGNIDQYSTYYLEFMIKILKFNSLSSSEKEEIVAIDIDHLWDICVSAWKKRGSGKSRKYATLASNIAIISKNIKHCDLIIETLTPVYEEGEGASIAKILAKALFNFKGNTKKAISILEDVYLKDSSEFVLQLFRYYTYLEQYDKASDYLETSKKNLGLFKYKIYKEELLIANKDYEGALKEVDSWNHVDELKEEYVHSKSYNYLKSEQYQLAYDFLHNELELVNFNSNYNVEIFNLELANKFLKNKVNIKRLDKMKKFNTGTLNELAYNYLINKVPSFTKELEEVVNFNIEDLFVALNWPVFKDKQSSIISLINKLTDVRLNDKISQLL